MRVLAAVLVSLVAATFGASAGEARAQVGTSTAPLPRRVLGVRGESCRAALDCRPELRCKNNVCVPRPEPKPDGAPRASTPVERSDDRPGPRDRLRLGVELSGGVGGVRIEETPLLGEPRSQIRERAEVFAAALGLVELGLDDDQVTFGLGAGAALPAGTTRDPVLQLDLRAGWRLWRGSPLVGFDLEPRVELFLGDLPGDFGVGGALAGRFRLEWIDVGLRLGGLATGEGRRREGVVGFREQLTVLHAQLYLGLVPVAAAW